MNGEHLELDSGGGLTQSTDAACLAPVLDYPRMVRRTIRGKTVVCCAANRDLLNAFFYSSHLPRLRVQSVLPDQFGRRRWHSLAGVLIAWSQGLAFHCQPDDAICVEATVRKRIRQIWQR